MRQTSSPDRYRAFRSAAVTEFKIALQTSLVRAIENDAGSHNSAVLMIEVAVSPAAATLTIVKKSLRQGCLAVGPVSATRS